MYFGSNIVNAAIPFVIMPIMTRYLHPAEYGEVAMFQTLLAVLVAMGGLGVVTAAARKFYDGHLQRDDLAEYMGSCVQILAASSAVLCVFVLVFRGRLSDWLGLSPKWIFAAVVACAALIIGQLRLGQFQVRKQARQYGSFQISRSALNMLLSLMLVVALNEGAAGRINAQIWSALIFAGLAVITLRRERLLKVFSWRPDFVKEALAFGVPLLPHSLGVLLLASVDRFVIKSELGLAPAGIYMVAVQVASGFGLLLDAVNKAYVPWAFERLKRNDEGEKRRMVRYTYLWYLVMLVAVVPAAFFIGPWVIVLIAGPHYQQAGEVIGWLILAQGLGGMYTMVGVYSHFARRTGLLSMATIVSGILNIALLVVLVKQMGIVGAAIAQTIGMGVRFVLSWWVAQRSYPMPWFQKAIWSRPRQE